MVRIKLKLVKNSVKEILYFEKDTLKVGYKAMFSDTGYKTKFAVALNRIFRKRSDIPKEFCIEIKELMYE